MRVSKKRRFIGHASLLAALAVLGMSPACSSFNPFKTSRLVQDVLKESGVPTELTDRIAFYTKYAEKFKRYTDGADISDSDVLDVLKDAGIVAGTPSSTSKPGSRPTGGNSTSDSTPSRKKFPTTPPGSWQWPTDAGVVSSEYGARWGKQHQGVDIAAEIGEPVKASAPGEVIYSGNGLRGYGNVLILQHSDKTTTLYAHNHQLLVKKGETVRAGEKIALLGNSGKSTGPHLHFEIRDGSTPVNPRSRLGKAPYALILEPSLFYSLVKGQPHEHTESVFFTHR